MEMLKNVEEAERSLVEKPLFATSVERYRILDELKSEYRDLPQPLRFSKMFSILLARVSTPLCPYDLIAGRCVDRELTPEEEVGFQDFIHSPDYPYRGVFLDSGHSSYDWDFLIENGLPALREQAARRMEREEDPERRVFLEAALEIYDAVIGFILRYADAAREAGMDRLAEALTEAGTRKPSTFRGALQLHYIVAFLDCAYVTRNPTLTLGRMDLLLLPLYRAGIADGSLTREDAAALITDFYCKHNLMMGRGEHQVGDAKNSSTFHRICNFDAPQYLLLAGTDREGRSAVNELTVLFAECIRPKFKNPVVVVRYYEGMAAQHPVLWKILIDKALDSSSLMFYNDNDVIAAYRRIGLPDQTCRNYLHFGCNWAAPGTRSAWLQGGPKARLFGGYNEAERNLISTPYMRCESEHSWPQVFLEVCRELCDRQELTMEDITQAFFARMSDFIDRKLEVLSTEVAVRERHPSRCITFGDCFYPQSIENAACFSACADYYFEFQSFQMFGTVADCFITVDELVFRQKKLTLRALLDATDADFCGYEDILALCRRVPKYGSDSELSNEWVKRLSKTATELVIEKNKPYLKSRRLFLEPCMQSDTWHLKLGESFGATPDGRRAGTPFSQNTRPSNGTCVNGLTGMFNSMLNLPAGGLTSGALNLDVQKKQYEGEEGHSLFGSLLATYFDRGGLHAQISSVNVSDLIRAQEKPDEYRDLRVRVTGYSAVYVDVCKRLQDDIIERMKN